MQSNPTNDRLAFIAKTYGHKKPEVVMDMIDIVARTVGVDDWPARLDTPAMREADPNYFEDLEKWYHARNSTNPIVAPTALATATAALVNALPQFRTRHRADALFPWMAAQLSKLWDAPTGGPAPEGRYAEWVTKLRRGGTMLSQWSQAKRPNLGQYTLKRAWDEAKEWEETEGPIPQGEVVAELDDGWTAQRLTTADQLDAEGAKMQHCVGSYATEVARGGTTIYSLRDEKGQPHVTIEVKNKRVQQTQGKQNEKPAQKYQKYVDEFHEWLEEAGISTEKVPAHLREIAAAIEEHDRDVEDEYLAMYAQDWYDNVYDAEATAGWMKMGLSANEAELAGALKNENVTPEEYGKFPYAVARKITDSGGVPRELEALVAVARMTNVLVELLPQRDPPLPPSKQVELFEREATVPKRRPGQDPQGPVLLQYRWDRGKTHLGYKSIAFQEWDEAGDDEESQWLYSAEEWLGNEYSPDPDKSAYVGPWFIHRFTPEQADEWWDIGIEDGDVAGELRNRRVTPKMVQDLENDRIGDMTAQQIVDLIDDSGVRRNTSKRRVSRRRR